MKYFRYRKKAFISTHIPSTKHETTQQIYIIIRQFHLMIMNCRNFTTCNRKMKDDIETNNKAPISQINENTTAVTWP